MRNRPLSVHFDVNGVARCQNPIGPDGQQKTTLKKKVTCKRCLQLMAKTRTAFGTYRIEK